MPSNVSIYTKAILFVTLDHNNSKSLAHILRLCGACVLQYSASRGVYGTPTFYVNGFVLPDAGSPLDFGGWKKVLDPLVQPHKVQMQDDIITSL